MKPSTLLATIGLITIGPASGQLHEKRQSYGDPQCHLCPASTVTVTATPASNVSTVTVTKGTASTERSTVTVTIGRGSTGLPVVTPNSTLSGAVGTGTPSAPYGYPSSSEIVQISSSTAPGGSVIVQTITKTASVSQSAPTTVAPESSGYGIGGTPSIYVLTITQGQNVSTAGAYGTASSSLPLVYTTTVVTALNQSGAVPTPVVPSTITYWSTQEVTIESCAPTVTDCPLRNGSSVIKTSTPVSTSVISTAAGPLSSTFVVTVTQSPSSTIVGPIGVSVTSPSIYVVTLTNSLATAASSGVPIVPVNSTSAPYAPSGDSPGPSVPVVPVGTGSSAASPVGTGYGPGPSVTVVPIGTGSTIVNPAGTGTAPPIGPVGTGSTSIGSIGVIPVPVNSTSSAPFAPTGTAPVSYGSGGGYEHSFTYSPSSNEVSPTNSSTTGPTVPIGTGTAAVPTSNAPVPYGPPGTAPIGTGTAPIPTGSAPVPYGYGPSSGTAPVSSSSAISPIGSTGFPPAPADNTSVPIRPQPISTLTTAPSGSVVILTDITTAYTTSCPASSEYSSNGSTLTSTFSTISSVLSTFQSTITVAANATKNPVTAAPSVTLAPEYASALGDLTSGLPIEALTQIVPSASVNKVVSSYIANLTAVLPTGAQPTGAVPTAIPTALPNGTATSPDAADGKGALSLADVFAWIKYIVSETFSTVSGSGQAGAGKDAGSGGKGHGSESYGHKSKRAHARDVRFAN